MELGVVASGLGGGKGESGHLPSFSVLKSIRKKGRSELLTGGPVNLEDVR